MVPLKGTFHNELCVANSLGSSNCLHLQSLIRKSKSLEQKGLLSLSVAVYISNKICRITETIINIGGYKVL